MNTNYGTQLPLLVQELLALWQHLNQIDYICIVTVECLNICIYYDSQLLTELATSLVPVNKLILLLTLRFLYGVNTVTMVTIK